MDSSASRATRRGVIKGAAWSAPAIVLVAAAPAMAASGPAALSVPAATATGIDGTVSDSVNVTSTIRNANTQGSVALTVVLTVTMGNANRWGVAPTATATGYGAIVIGMGSGEERSFSFTADAQIAGNADKAFNPVVTTGSTQNPAGTFTITATPGGQGSAGSSGSRSFN